MMKPYKPEDLGCIFADMRDSAHRAESSMIRLIGRYNP